MKTEDPNLHNRVQFFYKADDQYLHECEMDLTTDVADIILDQLKDAFSVELSIGSITESTDRVQIRFAASRQKLRSLQQALTSILVFHDRAN
ncbi:MAG: hypothetical protein AB8G22_26550 [Saprospiraceae bacterium]